MAFSELRGDASVDYVRRTAASGEVVALPDIRKQRA
jgi:hypothetical protein